MAKKSTKTGEPLPPPSLGGPRTIAFEKIEAQIEKGKVLRNRPIGSKAELDEAEAERSKWSKYNSELLTRLFDNPSIADEYNRFYGAAIPIRPTLSQLIDEFRESMHDKITRLEAIRDRLELIPELPSAANPSSLNAAPKVVGQSVFVVHGQDEAAKEAVARFIEKLDLIAVILHEQPNVGRTIIEKFEAYSDVGFAVVLLTPDDVGGIRDKATELKPRARQNVIFELGYFIGKLGRQRVCALYKEVEIPSDYYGVLYVLMDNTGAWRLALAKEMKQAGLDVDLNKAL